MSDNICTNTAYLNSIDQKRRFQIVNIPPVRYDNLASNPYQKGYTKYDLDMRRKAEILKYSSNRMPTQTNSLTKAQRLSQAVKGTYQSRTYSRMYLDKNTKNGVLNTCPIVKTPSSACDVPGPPILLYEDPSVPLYNLVNDTDGAAFGIINQDKDPMPMVWNNTFPTNVILNDNKTITSIYILNADTPSYNFNIKTPVVVKISGNLTTASQTYQNDPGGLRVTINKATVNVKYSYNDVTLSPTTTCQFETAPNLSFNITLNPQHTSYSATCYLGLLNISNLILPVQKGFIYDIQVSISYTSTLSDAYLTNCTLPVYTTYVDATKTIAQTPNSNCTVTGQSPIPSSFPILSISGTPAYAF
jgi:hypothetical protein